MRLENMDIWKARLYHSIFKILFIIQFFIRLCVLCLVNCECQMCMRCITKFQFQWLFLLAGVKAKLNVIFRRKSLRNFWKILIFLRNFAFFTGKFLSPKLTWKSRACVVNLSLWLFDLYATYAIKKLKYERFSIHAF